MTRPPTQTVKMHQMSMTQVYIIHNNKYNKFIQNFSDTYTFYDQIGMSQLKIYNNNKTVCLPGGSLFKCFS